ncbi:hypothetical protein [Pseudodesulfovibrio sp.]|uniref:hypothetical protein n=1 Tax=unclassified Pseudodesulfovibrio TaxID=2661612 RepID=UPI003AFFC9AA
MDTATEKAITEFLDTWTEDSNGTKASYLGLKAHLQGLDGVQLAFVARPGITYSLRATHANQKKRGLFAMVDVIDDDPADRWLSVCFYRELVDDPEGLGDEVPGGLLGEDARCFDLYEADATMEQYIKDRLTAACLSASREE